MKFTSKDELLENIEREHLTLRRLLEQIPKKAYREEGVWGDSWTLKDLLAHLTEWEQMFLSWYREGLEGKVPDMPAKGFSWRQTPLLNRVIWRKYRRKSLDRVLADFHASSREIFDLTAELSEEQLFTPGYYAWTGENTLTTYLGSNTFSHYRTASRIVRRWLREKEEG